VSRYVAFLRAINVGGRSVVRMSELCSMFERAGGRHVESLLASGNVLFDATATDAAAVAQRVGGALKARLGTNPDLVLRSLQRIQSLVDAEPFGDFVAGPSMKLYVVFLAGAPTVRPGLPLASAKEAVELIGISGREAFALSRPKPQDGSFGFPNAFVEAALGVAATTRNWSTVLKIAARSETSKAGIRRR
jgi:uncharacterized protein (DUF1697 family)